MHAQLVVCALRIYMKKRITLYGLIINLLFIFIFNRAAAVEKDSCVARLHFEVSFGQSVLFISNSDIVNLHNTRNIVLPTSSLLLFTELRTDRKVRIPFFFNLPTESKSFLVNNQLINEKASPTLGSGVQVKLFGLNLYDKARIEGEAGALAGVVLDGRHSAVAPLLAARLKILRGDYFVLYLGTTYTFGLNTMGLLYGTGSIF